MLVALTLTLVAAAGGTLATYLYDENAPPASRPFTGAVTGYAVLASVGFALASILGLGPISVAAATLVTAAPLALLAHRGIRRRFAEDLASLVERPWLPVHASSRTAWAHVIFLLIAAGLLGVVFDQVLFERAGGLATAFRNNFGDLPFHLQIIHSFALGENFPPEDPTYAGSRFAYPYMTDFLSALFVTSGARVRDAMLVQNVVLAVALVAILQRWIRDLTRDVRASFIGPVLVLASGGLGWLLLFRDALTTERGIAGLLGALPRDYTIGGNDLLRWGNAITTLLVPQRSMLFGLPLAIVAFTLIWHALAEPRGAARLTDASSSASPGMSPRSRRLFAAGLLTGLLPLIHVHSFLVVMVTASMLGALFREWQGGRWQGWVWFLVAALGVGLPELRWASHDASNSPGTFIGIELGWDHGSANVAWFWFANAGAFMVLLAVGYLWRGRRPLASRSLVLFSTPFLFWFAAGNVMRFAPWIWDNIKVLFYWYVGSVPLVALLLARISRIGPAGAALASALLLSMTLAGALDIWRALSGATTQQILGPDDVAIADLIRSSTEPRALVLHAAIQNAPVVLTGRRSLLGYPGHLWSHGLPYAEREADIKRIYAGDPAADDLLVRYGVDYVEIGPPERSLMPIDDAYFDRFPLVGEIRGYRLFKVRHP